MSELAIEGEIPAPVDDVWKLVSDFGGFISAQGMPVEVQGDGVGAVRTITFGTVKIVERLEAQDDESYSTTYHMLEGPFPFTNYYGTIQLRPAGRSATHLTWSGRYDPVGETDTAAAVIENVYQAGIKGLQRHFGAGDAP